MLGLLMAADELGLVRFKVRIAGTSGGRRDLGQEQESVLLRAIYI
jgi:hypothetical protein